MTDRIATGASSLEGKHMISILIFLTSNGPSRKKDIYEAVSCNPRMPDKLNLLEEMGLLTQDIDPVTRSTIVALTDSGQRVGELLYTVDDTIRSNY